MELTFEQYDIINSMGNIKINAVAGSGKTTTMIEYAKTRPKTVTQHQRSCGLNLC